jgi:hypothetical protein
LRKFAPMTASLLVRKGDATPSSAAVAAFPKSAPREEPVVAFAPHAVPAQPAQHGHAETRGRAHDPEYEKRIMIWIGAEDLERLEIAAIKKGTSRHDIASRAIDVYLRALAQDFPKACGCVSGSCGR